MGLSIPEAAETMETWEAVMVVNAVPPSKDTPLPGMPPLLLTIAAEAATAAAADRRLEPCRSNEPGQT